ncbi:hypothetical protein AWV80_29245 [Cupriavidus sp. UYMU48A]|nr:hypothetical protein AWV80_29245 [Cupriavidus sp. UYMU48A]
MRQGKDAGELLIQWALRLDVTGEHHCLGAVTVDAFDQRTELAMGVTANQYMAFRHRSFGIVRRFEWNRRIDDLTVGRRNDRQFT